MEIEGTRVTGETRKKFEDPTTKDVGEESGAARVTVAAFDPTIAEQLEAERLDKAMRGEEVDDELDEERETWTIDTGRDGSIRKSGSALRRLMSSSQEPSQSFESETSPPSSDS